MYIMYKYHIQISRTWDLDTCISTTSSMLQELNSEMVVIYVTGLLQGVSFCQDPGMAFTEDQITECQNIMEQFIPQAMKALFSHSDPRQLCCFYFDGLCS